MKAGPVRNPHGWDEIRTQAAKGGEARAEALTPEERTAIARYAAQCRHGTAETEFKRRAARRRPDK
jgi:hypothetical protein